MKYTPAPDLQAILPPLLACLPTAFASPQPPPALLPLLSPILRQRVQLLAPSSNNTHSETWLPLLSWHSETGRQLSQLITDRADLFELHPTSGEIEIGSIEPVKYRRLDHETLQAKITAPDVELVVIVLWCENTEENSELGKWLIAELRTVEVDKERSEEVWSPSMGAAGDDTTQKSSTDNQDGQTTQNGDNINSEDDDEYWNLYDRTPGRTPGPVPSGEDTPFRSRDLPPSYSKVQAEEEAYLARYAQIQPEMDADDPSETREAAGSSTLNGNTLSTYAEHIDQPTAQSSPASSVDASRVSRLEELAEAESTSSLVTGAAEAEPAIRQHISTTMKSLYRLCRATGMQRAEFRGMVLREIECCGIEEGYDDFD